MNKYLIRIFNDEKSYYGRFNNLDIGDDKALLLYTWVMANVANGHGIELFKAVNDLSGNPCRKEYQQAALMEDYKVSEIVLTPNNRDPKKGTFLRIGGIKHGANIEDLGNWFWFLCNDDGDLMTKVLKKNERIVRY